VPTRRSSDLRQNSLDRPLIDVGSHRVAEAIKYAVNRMPNRIHRLLRSGILRYEVLADDRVKGTVSANENRQFIRNLRAPLDAGFARLRLDVHSCDQSRASVSHFDY